MQLTFEKWHGAKNDFIIVPLKATDDTTRDSLIRQAELVCSRTGAGVGADGIIILQESGAATPYPEQFSIINSDGSIGATCGNGLRCAASFIYQRLREDTHDLPESVTLVSDVGDVTCQFLNVSPGSLAAVAANMGVPQVNDRVSWHTDAVKTIHRLREELSLSLQITDVGSCEIGNQHIVVFCEEAHQADFEQLGPAIQREPIWDGINLHVVEAEELESGIKARATKVLGGRVDDSYRALVWERGAGRTQACGSGACAIAACAFDLGLSSREDWLSIAMPGGHLFVKHTDDDEPAVLAGPAERVFSGQLDF